MNAIKKNIPNAITCLNLLFGCIAVVFIFKNRLSDASWMIVFAGIADFFDGMAARALKVHSPIGKELDSLADMVSFGVAPGMMIYQLIGTPPLNWIGLLVPIFAALRLAKFNIDTRQTFYFIGLPSPANALLIASFPLIIAHDSYWHTVYFSNVTFTVWFFSAIAVACSALMVSPINLFSLKIKDTSWNSNKTRYTFLILSLACFVILGYAAVPIVMLLYIILSLMSKKSFESPLKNE
ncbi:MAG TPA: CDP-diacylglycerol--serine O-phosphatidyltransferase [Bacteroidia bacterium]|nr:CDP-diacylglycerol--serine O-phosphatidyltransferase [Bacteroidia bacterium]